MKKYSNILKTFFAVLLLSFMGCVHDDDYAAPDLTDYQCQDLTTTLTLTQAKALLTGTTYTFTTDAVISGYVSSSDESGNIYKYLFIQDNYENPTEGLTISVDATSLYTKYPQGSKVYIKLNGLSLGKYGNALQLGYILSDGTFGRIPESMVSSSIFRSCTEPIRTIVPKVFTLNQLGTANDKYIGCLVQINNAEFAKKHLCNNYAPSEVTVDRQINDATSSVTTRVVRNSGYASFANQILPSGNGKFVGILSKYNSTYQFYINYTSDLNMTGTRIDGVTATCSPQTDGTYKTISEIKALHSGTSMMQITQNYLIKARVTANDETGNHYKYVYVEDATGGIKIKINKTNLYQDDRFIVGKEIIISVKDMYINNVSGEIQLGGIYLGSFGNIEDFDMYKYFFRTSSPIISITPTEKTITSLTTSDVGKWIKIKDLEFIDSDLGKAYAVTTTTNRTLKDCSGNTIILRTSNFATFASREIDGGKGDVIGILSIFNGTYQLWISNLLGADLDNNRCDGTVPPTTVFAEDFSGGLTNNWTAVSVTGAQVWGTATFGNPAPCAAISGFASGNQTNEDWLVSKAINLNGYTKGTLTFESDGRYTGNALEVYATNNYTGNVSTTTWTQLPATFDTNMNAWGPWVSSGSVNLNAFAGGNVYIAFKYTSTTSAASSWELDNVIIKGSN